jgi:rhodanese-related sulfurtransferase
MLKKCLIFGITTLILVSLFGSEINATKISNYQTRFNHNNNEILFNFNRYTNIPVEEAWIMLTNTTNGIQIPIDVRTNSEWIGEHINTPAPENPVHYPLAYLQNPIGLQEFMSLYEGEEIVLYCASGTRSTIAANILDDNDFNGTIYNMIGGINAWKSAGYPTISEQPPEINNVTFTISEPLDTIIGWENISCAVTDDTEVDAVQLVLTYPDLHQEYIPMNKDGDNYYYNITLTAPGGGGLPVPPHLPAYTYSIYADDTFGRISTSTPEEFDLPMNEDVDEGGKVHFMDLIAVSLMYNEEGPNGWVREDVDNGGKVHFMDLIAISLVYNEEW